MDESRTLLDCYTPLASPTLSVEQATELEQLFGALADRHRLRILNLLIEAEGEAVCVCEFTASLGLPQPSVSYHLKQLMDAGLLVRERRARFAFYAFAPRALERLGALIDLSAATGAPA